MLSDRLRVIGLRSVLVKHVICKAWEEKGESLALGQQAGAVVGMHVQVLLQLRPLIAEDAVRW